jgi:hypothetical protein
VDFGQKPIVRFRDSGTDTSPKSAYTGKSQLCCNHRAVPLLKFILVALLLTLTPGTSTKILVDSADLIIAGTVKHVQQNGTGSIELSGRVYDRLDFQAEILVDETIKGEPVGRRFILDYSTPSVDIVGNVAHGGLLPDTYRVIFLNKSGSGYKFVSPYSPSLPASPRPCGPDSKYNWVKTHISKCCKDF